MYNAATLKSDLIGLVGWRQNADSGGTMLTGLTTSSSGLWFNDAHPLLTFDNIESLAPKFSSFNLTTWLTQKTESGILRAVEDWIQSKFEVRTAKSLLESARLFDVSNRVSDLDSNDSKLVGLEIVSPRVRGVKSKIERIGLQFSQAQTITIKLFRSGTATALQTVNVAYTPALDVYWETVNWEMDGHGTYYLAYEQSAVSGQSVNGVIDYSYPGYYLANRVTRDYAIGFPVGKYIGVTPFENPGSFSSLDPSQNAYNVGSNYGLNIEFHAQCDYTDFISRHSDILKGLIQKRVAMDMLRELALNPSSRVNRHESNVDAATLLYEIDGDSQGRKGGISFAYENELKAARMDENQVDRICAPCRKRSVRYGSV